MSSPSVFGAWLSERDGVEVAVEVTRPQSGLSSETVMLEATSVLGAKSLVARMPPAGEPLLTDYDLTRQFRVQAALDGTAIPVAKPLALESDPRWVGSPFLVMWVRDADDSHGCEARVVGEDAFNGAAEKFSASTRSQSPTLPPKKKTPVASR